MENKVIKKLIILGVIVFSFALVNNAYAYPAAYPVPYAFSNNPVNYQYANAYTGNQGYSQYNYYQQSGYSPMAPQIMNPVNQINPVNPANPITPVNPYYINQGYPQSGQYGYYQQSGYSTSNVVADTPTVKPNVVNNYYYQTAPATIAKTSTTSTTKTSDTSDTSNTSTDSTNRVDNNGLGASAYNGITALSLRGSGSFMPSSIWQWIFVIILILIIIIIARMFVKKPTVEQESHIAHAH